MQAFSFISPLVIIGALLLALALAVTFAAPIFALPIALVAVLVFLIGRAAKRGGESTKPRDRRVPTTEEAAKPEPEPAGSRDPRA
jgi:hypothetical protein